jgi:hypothetical protein
MHPLLGVIERIYLADTITYPRVSHAHDANTANTTAVYMGVFSPTSGSLAGHSEY